MFADSQTNINSSTKQLDQFSEEYEIGRTKAYEKFANKETRSKVLEKTRMCRHNPCVLSICTFAHSYEELKDPQCIFDEFCQYRKFCKHKHSDETREEYHKRLGVKLPKKQRIVRIPPGFEDV